MKSAVSIIKRVLDGIKLDLSPEEKQKTINIMGQTLFLAKHEDDPEFTGELISAFKNWLLD